MDAALAAVLSVAILSVSGLAGLALVIWARLKKLEHEPLQKLEQRLSGAEVKLQQLQFKVVGRG